MHPKKRDFDGEAAAWNEHPGRVKLAKDVARAISQQVALTPQTRVMEFGCGTGLLATQLQPLVHSIVGADTSQGMLDVFKSKIAKLELHNVRAAWIDPAKSDPLAGNYDLIVSSMTLHHVEVIEPLIAQFHKITAPGGHLCIADLDLEAGRFHDDNSGVFHFGFDRHRLRNAFMAAGFDEVRDSTAAEMVKPAKSGEMQRFTIFLLTGKKNVYGGGNSFRLPGNLSCPADCATLAAMLEPLLIP